MFCWESELIYDVYARINEFVGTNYRFLAQKAVVKQLDPQRDAIEAARPQINTTP